MPFLRVCAIVFYIYFRSKYKKCANIYLLRKYLLFEKCMIFENK
jgi:hypothetical protein